MESVLNISFKASIGKMISEVIFRRAYLECPEVILLFDKLLKEKIGFTATVYMNQLNGTISFHVGHLGMEAQIFTELFQRSEAARLLKGRKEERSEEGREGERKKEKGGKNRKK